jgi:hypothetical protein
MSRHKILLCSLWNVLLIVSFVSLGVFFFLQPANEHVVIHAPSPMVSNVIQTSTNPIKVYIYNWSSEIINRWPRGYRHKRLSTEAKFQTNNGAGPVVDLPHALYHTHQYSVFTLFYERLKATGSAEINDKKDKSFVITSNPEEAEAFFIPYDIGMDASTRDTDGALTATNCPMMFQVMQLLQESPYFQRKQGRDHFVIHSINHMMLFFMNKQCRKFYQEESEVVEGQGLMKGKGIMALLFNRISLF